MALVNLYVDGFNLYYGALKRTPYKWLDLSRLGQTLLPADTIVVDHVRTTGGCDIVGSKGAGCQ